jgi:hypothetical protein
VDSFARESFANKISKPVTKRPLTHKLITASSSLCHEPNSVISRTIIKTSNRIIIVSGEISIEQLTQNKKTKTTSLISQCVGWLRFLHGNHEPILPQFGNQQLMTIIAAWRNIFCSTHTGLRTGPYRSYLRNTGNGRPNGKSK